MNVVTIFKRSNLAWNVSAFSELYLIYPTFGELVLFIYIVCIK